MQSVAPRTSCRSPITDMARVLDENAIDELISYYGPLLSVIANRQWCSHLRSQFGVSDAIQNTWMAVVRNAPKEHFKNRQHFVGYLTTTLRNQIRKLQRKLTAKKRGFDEKADWDEAQEIDSIPNFQEADPIDRLIQQELARSVMIVLHRQPREIQRLLRWRYRKAMSYSQIGAKIDRKADDVRYLINTCIREISREVRSQYVFSR